MRRPILVLLALALLPIPGQATGFSDVRASEPDAAAIAHVQARGIMTGVGGRFEPDRPVTRAELAKIVAKANGIEIPAVSSAPFPDVPVSHSLAREVAAIKAKNQWYVENGHGDRSVLQGYSDGTFRPQATTTYPEASKILLGAALVQPRMGRAYFVQKDFPGYQDTALSDFYNHAAQTDIFERPIDWYSLQASQSVLRREVARALASMDRWETASAPYVCKAGAEWDARTRANALWSPEIDMGTYSDICVSEDLGLGVNVYNRVFAGQTFPQIYVFRADDRTERAGFDGHVIGSVHTATTSGQDATGCELTGASGALATVTCGESVRTHDLLTGATRYIQ